MLDNCRRDKVFDYAPVFTLTELSTIVLLYKSLPPAHTYLQLAENTDGQAPHILHQPILNFLRCLDTQAVSYLGNVPTLKSTDMSTSTEDPFAFIANEQKPAPAKKPHWRDKLFSKDKRAKGFTDQADRGFPRTYSLEIHILRQRLLASAIRISPKNGRLPTMSSVRLR